MAGSDRDMVDSIPSPSRAQVVQHSTAGAQQLFFKLLSIILLLLLLGSASSTVST